MNDFYASDLGTTLIPESKYYWQNEENNCCILVNDGCHNGTEQPIIHFLRVRGKVEADSSNPDTLKVTAPEGYQLKTMKLRTSFGMVRRPENCPAILDYVLDLVENKSWSFPRAIADKPYITADEAEKYESIFKDMVQDRDPDVLYMSVQKAGSMLCERLGIETICDFYVNHYKTNINTQIDENIEVNGVSPELVKGKKIVVIDDLISSGRTAKAIIEFLQESGAADIKYYALYRTVCSSEVELPTADNIKVQTLYPLSNAYWTYGRGFDLSNDVSRNTPDIYAATKHWDWETPEHVQELINYFADIPSESNPTV